MAQFKDLTDDQLQKLGDRIIRNASARIKQQVPTPSRNPFSKGKLSRSLQFKWRKQADGVWALVIDYADHGAFTLFGTRKYYSPNQRVQSVFGYDFRGYNKAKGGVRPQLWLSLRGDQPIYEAIVEAEVRTTWKAFIQNTLSPLTKSQ